MRSGRPSTVRDRVLARERRGFFPLTSRRDRARASVSSAAARILRLHWNSAGARGRRRRTNHMAGGTTLGERIANEGGRAAEVVQLLVPKIEWPDSVALSGHDGNWDALMGTYSRLSPSAEPFSATVHGAPRYELELARPFQHPWRSHEFYTRVHLVHRAGGHWTIGPAFDTNSGLLGDKILNRGWIRTVRPAAAVALPGRGTRWRYLGVPRLGVLGLHGRLEIASYVEDPSVWLDTQASPTCVATAVPTGRAAASAAGGSAAEDDVHSCPAPATRVTRAISQRM